MTNKYRVCGYVCIWGGITLALFLISYAIIFNIQFETKEEMIFGVFGIISMIWLYMVAETFLKEAKRQELEVLQNGKQNKGYY